MSSFTTCLVLVFGVVACGSGPAAARSGSVVEGCDAAHDPTPAAAYAQYLAQGGEPVEAPRLVQVLYDKKPTVRFDVIYGPAPHMPTTSLGTVYRCKLYRDDAKLAKAIVLDAGWSKADAEARKRIALDTDWSVFGNGVNLVPPHWDNDYPFHAPELVVLADGGIQITQWRNHPHITSYMDGSQEDIYVREQRIFAADGSVSAPTKLVAYNAGVNKHANFRSGSLR